MHTVVIVHMYTQVYGYCNGIHQSTVLCIMVLVVIGTHELGTVIV